MKFISRHKTFIKDMRNFRLTDTQAIKFFLYVACLLNDEPLPPEAKDHALQGEWSDFRELHLGGDSLPPTPPYLSTRLMCSMFT